MTWEEDRQQFALLMGELGAAYRLALAKETMAVYFKHLACFPVEAVAWAVDRWIDTERRFPEISQLISLAHEWRPRRAPVVADCPQIDEFTAQQCEEARQQLADLVAGLGQEMAA